MLRVRPFSKITTALSLGVLIYFFQNCGGSSSHTKNGSNDSLSISGVACGDMKALFKQTYYPFTKSHCVACHVTSGIGKGTFADKDFELAWNAFDTVGFSRVSENAVNPDHKPPYTGSQNQAQINQLKQIWVQGLTDAQACGKAVTGGFDNIGNRLVTTNKKIGLTTYGTSKVLSWNLSNEMVSAGLPLPAGLTAGTVEVKVQLVDNLGQIAYYVSEPRIRNSSGDLNIIGMRNIINKKYVDQETTFAFINKEVYNNTVTLLSTGTSVILGVNHTEDTLALSFGTFEVVTLPPPDLGPTVNLSKTSEINNESDKVIFNVTLNREPSGSTSTTVTLRTTSATTAKPRQTQHTTEEPYDNFDWDFTFDTVAKPKLIKTLTFTKGEPLTQTVEVLINDDMRDENDETLEIEIGSVENGQIGTAKKFNVTIVDNDAAVANPFVSTYSKLMSGSGVLKMRCLECHNTDRHEGGYDMTDYGAMLTQQVLVPGNPNASQMYQRIRLQGAGRMPLDQSLTPVEQSQIEQWITGGAQNN